MVVAPVDESEGNEGDGDFAEDAYEQWSPTAADKVAEVGAEADSCEGGKEGPAGEVAEAGELALGEEARRGEE